MTGPRYQPGDRIHCIDDNDMLRTMRNIRSNGGEVVLAQNEQHTLIIVKGEKVNEITNQSHDPFGYYGDHS